MANPNSRGRKSYISNDITNIKVVSPENKTVLAEYPKHMIPPNLKTISIFLNPLHQGFNGAIYINNKLYPGIGGKKTFPNMPEIFDGE